MNKSFLLLVTLLFSVSMALNLDIAALTIATNDDLKCLDNVLPYIMCGRTNGHYLPSLNSSLDAFNYSTYHFTGSTPESIPELLSYEKAYKNHYENECPLVTDKYLTYIKKLFLYVNNQQIDSYISENLIEITKTLTKIDEILYDLAIYVYDNTEYLKGPGLDSYVYVEAGDDNSDRLNTNNYISFFLDNTFDSFTTLSPYLNELDKITEEDAAKFRKLALTSAKYAVFAELSFNLIDFLSKNPTLPSLPHFPFKNYTTLQLQSASINARSFSMNSEYLWNAGLYLAPPDFSPTVYRQKRYCSSFDPIQSPTLTGVIEMRDIHLLKGTLLVSGESDMTEILFELEHTGQDKDIFFIEVSNQKNGTAFYQGNLDVSIITKENGKDYIVAKHVFSIDKKNIPSIPSTYYEIFINIKIHDVVILSSSKIFMTESSEDVLPPVSTDAVSDDYSNSYIYNIAYNKDIIEATWFVDKTRSARHQFPVRVNKDNFTAPIMYTLEYLGESPIEKIAYTNNFNLDLEPTDFIKPATTSTPAIEKCISIGNDQCVTKIQDDHDYIYGVRGTPISDRKAFVEASTKNLSVTMVKKGDIYTPTSVAIHMDTHDELFYAWPRYTGEICRVPVLGSGLSSNLKTASFDKPAEAVHGIHAFVNHDTCMYDTTTKTLYAHGASGIVTPSIASKDVSPIILIGLIFIGLVTIASFVPLRVYQISGPLNITDRVKMCARCASNPATYNNDCINCYKIVTYGRINWARNDFIKSNKWVEVEAAEK